MQSREEQQKFVRAIEEEKLRPFEIQDGINDGLITVDQLIGGLKGYLKEDANLPACLVQALDLGLVDGRMVKDALDHHGLGEAVVANWDKLEKAGFVPSPDERHWYVHQ